MRMCHTPWHAWQGTLILTVLQSGSHSLPAAAEKHDLRKSRISISSSPHASWPAVSNR